VPEVVLLYKAKAPRERDQADFSRVGPLLTASAKSWLASALAICHPRHPWRASLSR